MRKIKKIRPVVKVLKFPQLKNIKEEFLIGALPAYFGHYTAFERELESNADRCLIFENQDAYKSFRLGTLQVLFDLIDDTEHRPSRRKFFGYERLNTVPFAEEDEEEYKEDNEEFRTLLRMQGSPERDFFRSRLNQREGHISVFLPEGRTIRTLVADNSVFEGCTIKMITGEVSYDNGRLGKFKIARSADNLNLSLDYLVRAGIVSERSGGKPIEILVVGTEGITEADIQKRIDQIIGDGEEYRRQVGAALPNEKHSALMGGVGISAGYHRHTKNFIFNLRTGVDHIWGKFKQTGLQHADTENVPKLGWGITLGAGVDYKFTEKSTIGLEGGVRLSEFKIPQQEKPTSTKSSWFMAPYAQIVCGFYPHPDYSVSVFTGYFFPRTFSVKTEGTRIPEGTKCKVDGIFGGLRFARYF